METNNESPVLHLEDRLRALSDHDLGVVARLSEGFVAVDDERGKKQRRDFWRTLTVMVVLEQDRRQVEYKHAETMMADALGVGPITTVWTEEKEKTEDEDI